MKEPKETGITWILRRKKFARVRRTASDEGKKVMNLRRGQLKSEITAGERLGLSFNHWKYQELFLLDIYLNRCCNPAFISVISAFMWFCV